ncbi:MAG TPA: response regulator [Thermomicrobiales bacterium]|nr:response regulator [Thermomicrobiales bacterium]
MESNEHRQTQRQHIFAVNGAIEFLEVLRELLQEEEYNVTTTNFVPDTYEQIEALQPDLLIVDLAVGQQAGWDLLKRLADEARTNEIPVIVFSTNPKILEDVQKEPERFGGQRFLRKPIDLDEILDAIHELIGKA